MKAIVEEQEVQSAVQVVPRVERRNPVVSQEPTRAREIPKTDTYPSCLDLAAEFLARG